MSIEFIENIKPTSILKSNNALRRLQPTFNAGFSRSIGFEVSNNVSQTTPSWNSNNIVWNTTKIIWR